MTKPSVTPLSTIAGAIARPVVALLPFFVATFVLWAASPLLQLYHEIANDLWRTKLLHSIFRYLTFAFFYCYCATAIVYRCRKRAVKIGFYIVSLTAFYIFIALYKIFYTCITPHILLLAAETNADEAGEFFRTYAMSRGNVTALTTTAIAALLIIVAEKLYGRHKHRAGNTAAAMLSIAVAAAAPTIIMPINLLLCSSSQDVEQHFVKYKDCGIDTLSQIINSILSLHIMSSETKQMLNDTLHEATAGDARLLSTDSLTLVVVVGESFNKHHSNLYDYRLNTTPRLAAERDSGNLIVFNNAISPYNITSATLKNVFSTCLWANGERWNQKPLAVATMRRAGYDVLWWDNQIAKKNKQSNNFDFSLNSMLFHPKIDKYCYTARNVYATDYDSCLVDDLAAHMSKLNLKSPRRLVVLHLIGQHLSAEYRYPSNDARWLHFTADSVPNNASYIDDPARNEIAHYDNATRYNDAVMGKIFDMFKNENAVIIYFSDHGEEVYDYRYMIGRNHNGEKNAQLLHSQNDIPFMIWLSARYAATHRQVKERIAAAASKPIMNTDLVQMLFDLGDVVTPHRVDSLNPLSPVFKPYRRMVYDSIDYDRVVTAVQYR